MLDESGRPIQELLNDHNYQLIIPRHDIIFFIYYGTTIQKNYKEWLNSVEYSIDYKTAKLKRDTIYNNLLEGI